MNFKVLSNVYKQNFNLINKLYSACHAYATTKGGEPINNQLTQIRDHILSAEAHQAKAR